MIDESFSSDDSLEESPYQIVEFCGEENEEGKKMIEIINNKWVYRESKNSKKGYCYYPPKKDYAKIETWLKARTERKSSWEKFDVEILASADDFASAQRRLKRLYKDRTNVESHVSDSESSGEDILSKKRGASMLKASNSLKPQRAVTQKKTNDSSPVRLTPICRRLTSESALSDTQSQLPSATPQTADRPGHSEQHPNKAINLPQTRGERKTELQGRLQSLQGKADFQTQLLIDYLDAKLEFMTLKLQDEIQNAKRAQQYDFGKKVEDLKNTMVARPLENKNEPSPRALLGVELPTATLEEFEKLEQMLNTKSEINAENSAAALEKQVLLKRVMKTLAQGTTQCDKSVNAIMEGLMKKAVQQYYSGLGRKVHGVAKRNFSATLSYACMKDVLEQKYESEAVKLKISTAAGTFLTLWRDREGGAAERRSKARADNTQ